MLLKYIIEISLLKSNSSSNTHSTAPSFSHISNRLLLLLILNCPFPSYPNELVFKMALLPRD